MGAVQDAVGERSPLTLPNSEPCEADVQPAGQNRPALAVQKWLDGVGGTQMPASWSVLVVVVVVGVTVHVWYFKPS